jgi:hypothetical protein
MPRPDKETRKRIEARRAENKKKRDDAVAREKQTVARVSKVVDDARAAHEKRVAARVSKIVDDALDRTRARDTLPDIAELVAQLDEARMAALACYPPQAGAAVAATMAAAKLLGYVVDKSAVAIGDFREGKPQTTEELIADMRDQHGEEAAQRFLDFIENERRIRGHRGDFYDRLEARRLGNGSANGADDE